MSLLLLLLFYYFLLPSSNHEQGWQKYRGCHPRCLDVWVARKENIHYHNVCPTDLRQWDSKMESLPGKIESLPIVPLVGLI